MTSKADLEDLQAAFAAFAAKWKLAHDARRVDRNPEAPGCDGAHWFITLRRGKKKLGVYVSTEREHEGEAPSLSEVLALLVDEANMIESAVSFDDWAGEWGYGSSTDAAAAWASLRERNKKLHAFLGRESYRALLA